MEKLKFTKMWEGANMFVYDIHTGTVIPLQKTLPQIASHADKHFLYYFNGKTGGAYYENTEMEKAGESGLNDFLDKSFQENYLNGVSRVMRELEDYLLEVKDKNVEKLEDNKLEKTLIKGVNLVFEIFGYYACCQENRVLKLEEYIKEKLKNVVEKENVESTFTTLSTSSEPTFVRQEEIDFLNIILDSKENNIKFGDPLLKEKIEKHHKKYWLLNAADGNKPYNVQYFEEKLKAEMGSSLDEIQNKLENLKKFSGKIKEDQNEIIKNYKIDNEILELCELLAKLGHLRLEMRVRGFIPAYYFNEKILEEIGRRRGYSEDIIRFLSWDEILALFSGESFSKDVLQKRKESFLVFLNDGQLFIYAGDEAKEKFKEIVKEEDVTSVKEIKGNIAMKGVVRGKAVVFKWGEDMQKKLETMDENSILIAGQTRPQLMSLISKSKAIVTDEGGITSHAAIVSRELKIPCLIGTKIATQVIKSGDIVEVDANEGLVRLLG